MLYIVKKSEPDKPLAEFISQDKDCLYGHRVPENPFYELGIYTRFLKSYGKVKVVELN